MTTDQTNTPLVENIYLSMPASAWSILAESLELDSRSHAATKDLRELVSDSLAQVEEMDKVSQAMIDLRKAANAGPIVGGAILTNGTDDQKIEYAIRFLIANLEYDYVPFEEDEDKGDQ